VSTTLATIVVDVCTSKKPVRFGAMAQLTTVRPHASGPYSSSLTRHGTRNAWSTAASCSSPVRESNPGTEVATAAHPSDTMRLSSLTSAKYAARRSAVHRIVVLVSVRRLGLSGGLGQSQQSTSLSVCA
jgi:hypothetical protein